MFWHDKVVWQEGMFLRAQHFQQMDRYTARQLQARSEPLRPHPWGLTELSVDRDLLAAGRFALSVATGVLEDGTPFSIPGGAEAPLPLELPEGTRNAVVYLALPLQQDGNHEVSLSESGSDDVRARYGLRNFQAFDTHSDSTMPAELSVGRLRLRYLLESAEPAAGYSRLGLARVVEVQADRRVQLDERFIPSCLRVSASPVLANLTAELVGLLGQRAEVLAGRLGQPGARGVADIADFLLLQAVNRWQPLLAHWADAGNVHPESLFSTLVQLAGELATFTAPDKRASTYPAYRHDDLQRSFATVVTDLRRWLSSVLETNAVAIPLQEPRFGIRVGAISDRNLLRNRFVVAVSADIPGDQIRRLFPNKVKVGAVEHIKELVNVSLPGIAVQALPVAPRQIPFRSGAAYFELDRSSPHWQQMMTSGGFGIHISDEFPNLSLELWAIRE
jgi:type VI secretion system protein ImpJ